MATLQTRVDNARTLNYVDSSQYTDAQALLHSNIIIHQIEDFIVQEIWERFFWDILSVDNTVINQNEYTLPTLSSGLFEWANKVEVVTIQYRTWWDFIKAREVNFETLEHDLTWYNNYQSEADPIYFVADKSVFIYPSPKVAIEWAIKFYWIKSLSDVTLATTDSDLFGWKIPTKYYYLISDWLEQFILRTQWKRQEAIQAKDRFDNVVLPSIVDKLWNRKVGISVRQPANISKYK